MIGFDFDYYKPATIEEAVICYKDLIAENKKVMYFSGGTEIISQARLKKISFDAVIDLKDIEECNIFGCTNDQLIIGSAITLSKIVDSNLFPFLGVVCKKIAEHTSRNKITIGGNICGKIPYREAVLPLLLSEANFVIASKNGLKTIPITEAFDKVLKLEDGEFLVQILININYLSLPYLAIKKTKYEKVDYPLVTVAAIKEDYTIKTAFSGLYPYPFGSLKIDDVMNNIPDPILNDIIGSDQYRKFVTKYVLNDILVSLGGK